MEPYDWLPDPYNDDDIIDEDFDITEEDYADYDNPFFEDVLEDEY